MTPNRPAFYARTGSVRSDLAAVLHLPYTAWHLAYVAIGASFAERLDWTRLGGTLLAFSFGLGVGAHALDELRGRPLGTRLSDRTLMLMGVGGLIGAVGIGAIGAATITVWVLPLAVLGALIAAGYSLEWVSWLHTDVGFALAWGGYPVLVGYWAQTLEMTAAVVLIALGAVLLSLGQRRLSTPARFVRRSTRQARVEFETGSWTRAELLATWEVPLLLLSAAIVTLAVGLLLSRL